MRLTATILLIAQLLARSLAVQHGHAPNECRSHGIDHDASTHVHIGLWGGPSDDASHARDTDGTDGANTSAHTHDTNSTEHAGAAQHAHAATVARFSHVPPERDSFVFSLGSPWLAAPEPRVAAPSLDATAAWLAEPGSTDAGSDSLAIVMRCAACHTDTGPLDGHFLFLTHVLRI